jgi:hypothetical protein
MAHITLLQGIINRLAGASTSCKTWCLTLITALLSLSGATHKPAIVTLTLVPIAMFGFMDVMYLAQEGAYRTLYAQIVAKVHAGTYSRSDTFAAKAPRSCKHICDALTSWAILPIYGGLIVLYIVAVAGGWLALLGS